MIIYIIILEVAWVLLLIVLNAMRRMRIRSKSIKVQCLFLKYNECQVSKNEKLYFPVFMYQWKNETIVKQSQDFCSKYTYINNEEYSIYVSEDGVECFSSKDCTLDVITGIVCSLLAGVLTLILV